MSSCRDRGYVHITVTKVKLNVFSFALERAGTYSGSNARQLRIPFVGGSLKFKSISNPALHEICAFE
jgi:hypothetical protein